MITDLTHLSAKNGPYDMTMEENSVLEKHSVLVDQWSWFEIRMHSMQVGYYILSNFTDPLFRPLRNSTTKDMKGFVPDTDGIIKFSNSVHYLNVDEYWREYAEIAGFLQEYFASNKETYPLVRSLASTDLKGASFAFAVPVCAANCVIFLSRNDPKSANRIAQDFVRTYDSAFAKESV